MSWNDERVELLSKLWLEGRSASQIATELGQGVTRNAVIGKVHRLGLSGRTKIAAPAAAGAAQRTKASSKAEADLQAEAIADQPAIEAEAEVEAVVAAPPPPPPVPIPIADVVIPFSTRVTIMDLRESMCRWPIGDPSSAEFRYCGSKAELGPYCMEHARLAFQPTQERRRVERFARIA
jgi:GcrA cell cycle regulator